MPLEEGLPEWLTQASEDDDEGDPADEAARGPDLELALREKLPDVAPKAIAAVLRALPQVAVELLDTRGVMSLQGLVELRTKVTQGTPARAGINPFTKQRLIIKGTPTVVEVHAYPHRALRDAVSATRS
jgi:hypothetical protein